MTLILGASSDADRYRLTLGTDLIPAETISALESELASRPDERLVIVGPDAPLQWALDLADRYRTTRPELGIVLLRRRLDASTLGQALRSGVRDAVDAEDAQALLAAIRSCEALSDRISQRQGGRVGDAQRGKVIAICSPKGGTGKTSLATNLALALAQAGHRTCLADFDLAFGDVAVSFQADPKRTAADALGLRGAFDDHGVASLLVDGPQGLHLLLAPTRPADAEFIEPELVGQLLDGMARQHDVTIVDTAPALDDIALKALDVANTHIVLTTPDIAAVKTARVASATLDALGHDPKRRQFVVNQANIRSGLSGSDIQHLLQAPVAARIPLDPAVLAGANSGRPCMASAPRSAASSAIRALGTRLIQGARA